MGISYATRGQVRATLEASETARGNALIDAKNLAGARAVESLARRRFYPERRTTKYDFPNYQSAAPWQLYLGSNSLISLETLTSGGVTISGSDVFLRRADDIDEPPYDIIELDRGSSAAFSAGDTPQRTISVLGLHGFNDTETTVPSGQLGGNINASVTSVVINPSAGRYTVDVGSLILCGTERMVCVERAMSDTGVNTTSTMDDAASDKVVTVGDGSGFAVGETILIGSERMSIVDKAGNNLFVKRAVDGTVLATHASGDDVYALRTFTVERGQCGSTAASHSTSDSVYAHDFSRLVPPVYELALAETVTMLEMATAGYSRTIGSGGSEKEISGSDLNSLRDLVRMAYGRTRSAAI